MHVGDKIVLGVAAVLIGFLTLFHPAHGTAMAILWVGVAITLAIESRD